MIEQELIDKCNWEMETFDSISVKNQKALIDNYIKLIEQNAELHKVNAKLRTENKELYQESAKDKGL